jgi:hypothetical protein
MTDFQDGSPEPVFVTRLEGLGRYGDSIPYAELEVLTGEDGPSEIHAVLERREDRLQMRLNSTGPEPQDLRPVLLRWSCRPDMYLALQPDPANCDSVDTYQLGRSSAGTAHTEMHARLGGARQAGTRRRRVRGRPWKQRRCARPPQLCTAPPPRATHSGPALDAPWARARKLPPAGRQARLRCQPPRRGIGLDLYRVGISTNSARAPETTGNDRYDCDNADMRTDRPAGTQAARRKQGSSENMLVSGLF